MNRKLIFIGICFLKEVEAANIFSHKTDRKFKFYVERKWYFYDTINNEMIHYSFGDNGVGIERISIEINKNE